MAAFSYDKNHPFLLDSSSMFLFSTHHNPSPLTTNIDNNHNIYNPCFSTHQHHPFHNQPDPTVEVSSSVNISTSSTKVSTLSNNSSSSAVTAQYNQIINPMDKRKNNSKLKGKKQRKETSIDEDQVNNKKKCKRSGDNNNYNQETGYIHVRARRGQATDSHSLAERVRREKISGKMKLLQSLVPGCDKVTGKALMLDEIINYVQSLQNQIEFLSLKITSVNPMLYDFGMDMDAFMVKPQVENQRSSSLEATQQADVQHQNHTQATNNNIFNTSGGYSVMDTSTLHQLQQAYMSNIMSRPQ